MPLSLRYLLALLFVCAMPSIPARALTTAANVQDLDLEAVPWVDGEKLTYRVTWGPVEAVEGTFTAIDHGKTWEFKLQFRSIGSVEDFYPMRDWFWSICTKKPWRSVEYGEERFESTKHYYERTDVNYAKQEAVRHRWFEGKEQIFKTPAQAIDDVGSMLYSLRYGPWKVGQRRTFLVYEARYMRSAEANCLRIEKIPLLDEKNSPEADCYVIEVQPLDPNLRKKGYRMTLWMTADKRRIPVKCRMTFRYGTIESRLLHVVR